MAPDKKQVCVYLPMSLKQRCENEIHNLSMTVTELLYNYLNETSIEGIEEDIQELHRKVKVLEQRKKDLIQQGVAETKKDAMKHKAWLELQEGFKNRIEKANIEIESDIHLAWLQGPKNITLCNVIGLSSREVLSMLQSDYMKEEAKQHDTP